MYCWINNAGKRVPAGTLFAWQPADRSISRPKRSIHSANRSILMPDRSIPPAERSIPSPNRSIRPVNRSIPAAAIPSHTSKWPRPFKPSHAQRPTLACRAPLTLRLFCQGGEAQWTAGLSDRSIPLAKRSIPRAKRSIPLPNRSIRPVNRSIPLPNRSIHRRNPPISSAH